MSARLSRAMLTLATRCMGKAHRDWGDAMRAELEEAIDAGTPLRFAFSCLAFSLCRMPGREEGRFSLTAHAIAIGLMIPVASLEVSGTVSGFPRFLNTGGIAAAGSLQNYLLTSAYQGLIPLLAVLTLLLAIGQLRMAWMVLERDWPRVVTAGAMTLAAAITIIVLLGLLDFDADRALRQGAVLLIELAVLVILARWHAELPRHVKAHQADE